MNRPSIIIAIDGYSSTGKSSFAKRIAAAYGLLYLDSGALYRGVTLFAMENGFITGNTLDLGGMAPFLGDLHLHFEYSPDGKSLTYMGGRNVEEQIRTMAVSENVSMVAAAKLVRNYVDGILHEYGKEGGIIMDGRDIGTTVFPDAHLKIFMTADPQVRARRRMDELVSKGEQCTLEAVLKNLQERDWADSHREVSPLSRAEDAIDLDNTSMTFEDQMQWIGNILDEKFGIKPIK